MAKSPESPNVPPNHPVLNVIKEAAIFAAEHPNQVLEMSSEEFVRKFSKKPNQLGLREEEISVTVMQTISQHQLFALSAIYYSLAELSGAATKIESTAKGSKQKTPKGSSMGEAPTERPTVQARRAAALLSRTPAEEPRVPAKKKGSDQWNPDMLSTKDRKIFTKVADTLVDALGVDEDEVTPEATLIGDLGAESIDFLDIVFRLEKNFSVKIPRGDLFPESLSLADANFIQDGVVTSEGIEELRRRLPHADVDSFLKDPRVQNISELFTVQMVINYLKSKGV